MGDYLLDNEALAAAVTPNMEFGVFDSDATRRVKKITSSQLQTYLGAADLAGRYTLGVLGDSISGDSFTPTWSYNPTTPPNPSASSSYWQGWGWGCWLRRFLTQRINFPGSNQFGIPGAKVIDVLNNQLPLAVAARLDIAVVFIGTNSLGSETTSAIIAELTQIYQALIASGAYVIAVPIRCHNAANAITGTNLLQMSRVNRWIADYCAVTPNLMLLDVNPAYLDFATGNAKSTYLRDGIHDNVPSALAFGQLVANTLSNLIPAIDDRFMHLGDAFDPTNNVTGNLLTNGLMAGAGGTLLNGATGTPPTSWIGLLVANSTITLAFSKTADANLTNLTRATMTVGGTSDGALCQLVQQVFISAGTFAAGDTVQLEAECTFNITSGSFYGIDAHIEAQNASNAALRDAWDGYYNATSAYGLLPTGTSYTIVLKTDPMTIPASTDHLNIYLEAVPQSGGTVSATVTWGRASLRKIVAGG